MSGVGFEAPARPTRILRVIARLNTGGPAVHAILLTRGLNGGTFCSKLVTGLVGVSEGDMGYYARKMGVTPLVIPELGRDISLVNDLKAFLRLYRIIREECPDIVHTHTTKAGGLGRLATLLYNGGAVFSRRRRRARLVHSFHGHLFYGYFGPWKSRLLVLIERVLGLLTDRIITISESVKRDLVEVYKICPEGKVTIVPLGLDFRWVGEMEHRRGTLRKHASGPSDRIVIGIVGRLTAVKNHRMFLESVCLLDGLRVQPFVIGDGELRAELERMATSLGLEHRVTFTGWIRNPAAIYADLDIVCLTSLNEGTPITLIEAMAASRAFVATDVGGIRDLMLGCGTLHTAGFMIFENGVLVPSNDSQALAAALRFLLENRETCVTMGRAGQRWVGTRFSHERLVRDTKSVYTALLGLDELN